MPDPGTLRAAAARLNQLAGLLPPALDRVVGGSGRDVWQGPVADHFGDQISLERAGLGRAADELRDIARSVMVEADRLQAQLDAEREAAHERAAAQAR